MTDLTGYELYSQIAAYCQRVDCTMHSFAMASGVAQSTIDGWRRKDPRGYFMPSRALAFIAKHPNGFPGAQPARRVCDHADGGAASVRIARSRGIAPARPCQRAVAAAAAEDAWSQQRRARARGRSMVT